MMNYKTSGHNLSMLKITFVTCSRTQYVQITAALDIEGSAIRLKCGEALFHCVADKIKRKGSVI